MRGKTKARHTSADQAQRTAFVDSWLSSVQYVKSLPEAERARVLEAWCDELALWNWHSALPEPPPSDPLWSLLRPTMVNDTEQELQRALQRTAARFASEWRVFSEPVRQALTDEAEASEQTVQAVKERALGIGLVLALAEARKGRRIRLGEQWIRQIGKRRVVIKADGTFLDLHTRETGRWEAKEPPLAICAPITLPPMNRDQWLRHEAIRAAEAWLLDTAYPSTGSDALDKADGVDPAECDEGQGKVLQSLNVFEEAEGDRWNELLEAAPQSVRDRLERLLGLLRHGLELPDAKRFVADVRSERVGAIDTAFSRLRSLPEHTVRKRRKRL